MRVVSTQFVSEEEYRQAEETSEVKHEYYDGDIYAMDGERPSHCAITFNIVVAIGSRLRGRFCRGAINQRVKVATGLLTYPDVLIVCPPERYSNDDPVSLLNPRVIIEVLSPSTAIYDRTDKFDHYQHIPTLTDYILVAHDRVRVEHYQRPQSSEASGGDNSWTVRYYNQIEQRVVLPEIDLEMPLTEVYYRMDVPMGVLVWHDVTRS